MTFDDAKNCSFRPCVRSRLPEQLKVEKTELKFGKPNLKEALKSLNTDLTSRKRFKLSRLHKVLEKYINADYVGAY